MNKGYYIEPTLFANVDNQSRIAQEEIFGPVLCLIPAEDEEDAIRIANESNFGLNGSVMTTDAQAARTAAAPVGLCRQPTLNWASPSSTTNQSTAERPSGSRCS